MEQASRERVVAYVVYIDKYTTIRGTTIDGKRPTHIGVYVHSTELGTPEFGEFLQEVGDSLHKDSTPNCVTINAIHPVDVDRVTTVISMMRESVATQYKVLLEESEKKRSKLEDILNLGIWGYIKYRINKYR